ncbi:MAG: murein biosynthesis integral membrane protein MurJ [Nitratireductor sp.]|nr:murein biosynthesis integral membrane protein MurJ [Nitratireductor sp.]
MGLVSKFLSVGSATLASRVLGFAREAMIAAFLGAGPVADAFYAAFRFPNLFRRLFAEGAFNSAFVPLFARELETGGRPAARQFAEEVLSSLLLVLLTLSALAMLFMPFLTGTVVAPKFADEPAKFELTVELGRIMFPYLTAMSLVAMFSGILNSFRRYFLAALAPVLLNVVLIAVLVFCWSNGTGGAALGRAMAWGVSVSGALQLALLAYGILREGFPVSLKVPRFSAPVKRLLKLAVPTAIAAGIAQINLLVGQVIASAQDGAIAILNYADRLMQLPLGIIAVSIGVVLLPELTRALAGEDRKEALKLQNRSVEFGLGLMVPAAIGLYLIPEALIALIYERGAFTRDVTLVTAQVLAIYSLGLPAVVLTKIFQPSFYSRQDTRTPMWFAGVNAAVNIALALFLFPRLGITGLAWAFSIASWVNAALLGVTLYAGNHYRPDSATLRNVMFLVFASGVMAVAIILMRGWLGASLLDAGLMARIGMILLIVFVSMAVYFAIALASGALPRRKLMRLAGGG